MTTKYPGSILTDGAATGYSCSFNGSNYLSVADNAALELGSNNFSVECWFNSSAASIAASEATIFSKWGVAGGTLSFIVFLVSGKVTFWTSANGSDISVNLQNSATSTANTWIHVAACRSGNTYSLFVNGTRVATTSSSAAINNNSAVVSVGATSAGSLAYAGSVNGFRIVNGSSAYDATQSTINVPTQLSPITNTALLTCQQPTIVDESSNAFTVTNNSGVTVSSFTPFPATRVGPTGIYMVSPAPGLWNLNTVAYWVQQGLWPGNFLAIEDVFSAYLYTGNGSTQTITNNIDLAGKGGMVWRKSRTQPSNSGYYNNISDTERGVSQLLYTNTTDAQTNAYSALSSFNSNGFTMLGGTGAANQNGDTYASWTFRKAPKFFDIVTYTGTGVAGRTVAHSLGSVPGMMIVKRTDGAGNWAVYHRTLGATKWMWMDTTSAAATSTNPWNDTAPTASEFTLGVANATNANGSAYVAYLFAHDTAPAGLVQCGSFTATSSGFSEVNLGWEPQYILFKRTDNIQNWYVWDVMRGMSLTFSNSLSPNLSDAEINWAATSYVYPTATGFAGSGSFFGSGANVVYMAIRRGPMKTPTDGTTVFKPLAASSSGVYTVNTGFPVDTTFFKYRPDPGLNAMLSRLTGAPYLRTDSNGAETGNLAAWDSNTTYYMPTVTGDCSQYINYCFQRAPGFFDVVCYTGNGGAQSINHNLGVAPELVIYKSRSQATTDWIVECSYLPSPNYDFLRLNSTAAKDGSPSYQFFTTPTSSQIGISAGVYAGGADINQVTKTYIAYLFVSCSGVSKVGSYAGTGATQTISCGFTGSPRFVLIKRTDSTGNWYVWDTSRGMVAGTDPKIALNSTAAETNANWVYTTAGGFQIVTTDASVNASGGSYIYLAIA